MLMVHAGGSSFSNGQGEPLDAPSCSMSCAGAASETCGGSWALSLYTTGASTGIVSALPSNSTSIPAGWTASGCRQDLVDHERTLTVDAFTSDAMTLAMCVEHCAVRGHTIAGVEYARECYCGSAFANGGGADEDATVKAGEWLDVKSFPTTVHVELLKHGKIPDPVRLSRDRVLLSLIHLREVCWIE